MAKYPFPKVMYAATLLLALSPLVAPLSAYADLIYESATLGPTGFTFGGFTPGAGLFPDQFIGSRFHLDDVVRVDAIGGHINGDPNGSLFGAIVSLSAPSALPSGHPFDNSTLAAVTFAPPLLSTDVRVPLSVVLALGDYALIFGGGEFGAFGAGAILNNGLHLPGRSFFFWDGGVEGCRDLGFDNFRFVVTGTVIPEPASLTLLGLAALSLFGRAWCRHVKVRESSRPTS